MRPWSLPKRFGFRVLLLFLLFRYDLPSPLNRLPGWDMYFEGWNWLTLQLARALQIEVPVHGPTGSGDALISWLAAASMLTGAVLGAVIWSLIQRAPTRHDKLIDFLQLYIRVILFTILLSYGIVKVLALQFPAPTDDRLLMTYGESSPMGLMWTFMGASKPYQIFAGVLEVAAAALMLSRRTTTLGGLLVCGVMGNVFLMNLCYDVPVKIDSAQLLLMGMVLVSLDAPRLISMLVLNRPVPAADQAFTWWSTGRWRLARFALCIVVFGFTFYEQVGPVLLGETSEPPPDPLSAAGVYDVTSSDGITGLRRLSVSRWWAKVYPVEGEITRLQTKEKSDEHRLIFSEIPGEPVSSANLVVSSGEQPGEYIFTGTWNDAPVLIRAKKRSAPQSLLTTRGFHWVSEAPFNR